MGDLTSYDYLLNSVTKKPQMKALTLGSGYQHRSWNSIKRIKPEWSVTFCVMPEATGLALAESIYNSPSVLWKSPEDSVAKVYYPVGGYSITYLSSTLVQISTTFEQQ